MTPTKFHTERFMRIAGQVLHRTRKRRRWTRRHLRAELHENIAFQTLATYEQASRRMSLVMFAQLAVALGRSPVEMLAEVWERYAGPNGAHTWTIDLAAAARLAPSDRLAPLRHWAQLRLRDLEEDEPAYVRIGMDALKPLAVLCRMDIVDLASRLPRTQETSEPRPFPPSDADFDPTGSNAS